MSNRIFARSPFIIEVNEALQISSKIEVFLWNGTGSAPSSPNYTLSKAIPRSTNLQTLYNVSPLIREFISFTQPTLNHNSIGGTVNNNSWCNVIIKRYKDSSTLLDTTTYYAFDGYSEYVQGYNYDRGKYLLDEGTYYYYYNSASTYDVTKAGDITLEVTSGDKVKFTNLVSGVNSTSTFASSGIKTVHRVNGTYWANGNKLEILNAANTVLRTYYFKPIEECKYTPLPIDFINKYGAWQREWFFKASYETLEMTNTEYNLMPQVMPSFNTYEGQTKTFNTNAKESIRVNTGWVNENFKNTIQEIMLSEKILLNNLPVRCKSKQIEKFKSINSKNINYTLEFDYNYNTINNVL
jgi:hypothetical protein